MELMYTIGVCLFIIYTAICVYFFNIPSSFSETFYLFNEKKKGLGILFPFVMVAFIFLLLPKWFYISDLFNSTYTFLCFLAGGGLLLVAASPFFKEQTKDCGSPLKDLIYRSFHGQGLVHTIGALLAMISSIIWAIVYDKWLILIFSLLFTIACACSAKNILKSIVFLIELFIFLSIILILL